MRRTRVALRGRTSQPWVCVQADRPLLTYGLADGDVLDIVPWQPAARTAITASVSPTTIELHQPHPALSSPTHALYLSWQKAADGLRAGASPPSVTSCAGAMTPRPLPGDTLACRL